MSLETVMKDINKKFKANLIHTGLAEYDYERIPFTSPRLNYITFGGLPEGKFIEFYGEEHGGKTTTAMDSVANYQAKYADREDRQVLWVDCEHTFDSVWANKIGVDVERLIIFDPDTQSAEEIFQIILDTVSTGEVGLVVLDSLGVMVSQQALDKDMTEKTYAGISKALTDFCGKGVGLFNKHKCTLIGINQERDDFNSMFGGKKTTGGRAWKHDCSVRLEFRMGNYIDEKGNKLTRGAESPAGNIVQVLMKKNKTCPPTRRTGYYTLKYLDGIDYLSDLIEVALKYGIIEKSGAWFTIVNIDTGEIIKDKMQGQNKVVKVLEEDNEILAVIEQLIDARIESDEVQTEEEPFEEYEDDEE